MKWNAIWSALAFACVVCPVLAHADDPNDPEMRDPVKRAHDHAGVVALNSQELAYVQQRDAGWRARGQAPNGYASDRQAYGAGLSQDARAQAEYAAERARYAREMAQWRQQVAACRGGDWGACGN